MPYDPQYNSASRAVMGQGPASTPFTLASLKNPAMTSPMAGYPAMGVAPVSPLAPGVGAPQGTVNLGGPQPGAFAGPDPNIPAPPAPAAGPGAFGGGPAPVANSRAALGGGAFGGGRRGGMGR